MEDATTPLSGQPATDAAPEPEPSAADFDAIKSLTRLGLGAATFAMDKLMSNLRIWENDVQTQLAASEPDVIVLDDADDEDDGDEDMEAPRGLPRDPEEIRLAMIGAMFDAQHDDVVQLEKL